MPAMISYHFLFPMGTMHLPSHRNLRCLTFCPHIRVCCFVLNARPDRRTEAGRYSSCRPHGFSRIRGKRRRPARSNRDGYRLFNINSAIDRAHHAGHDRTDQADHKGNTARLPYPGKQIAAQGICPEPVCCAWSLIIKKIRSTRITAATSAILFSRNLLQASCQ